MASQAFTERGGSEAEYRIYRAMFKTGRKEPEDFIFSPAFGQGLSFIVNSPSVGIKLIDALGPSGVDTLQAAASKGAGGAGGFDVRLIDESEALSRPERALSDALGG